MPLQLLSEIQSDGEVRVSLVDAPMPQATAANEVVVQVEATPINPSDIYGIFGPADFSTARATDEDGFPVLTFTAPQAALGAHQYRLDEPLPMGNEGAGVVVAAGPSKEAQALLGKTVAVLSGSCYAQFTKTTLDRVLPLPEGMSAVEGASWFINPVTALSMVETMKLEGHKAIVHTAAASNLGQMLVKICAADGIDLVNVVRRDEQAQLLRDLGAKYVVNSSSPTFQQDLVAAIVATGATIAFDATGGGTLAGDILSAMEQAIIRRGDSPGGRYGSDILKQVYIYGFLDRSGMNVQARMGLSWSISGYLVMHYLQKAGAQKTKELFARVARELSTTFRSNYTAALGLADILDLDAVAQFGKMATGEKFLVLPNAPEPEEEEGEVNAAPVERQDTSEPTPPPAAVSEEEEYETAGAEEEEVVAPAVVKASAPPPVVIEDTPRPCTAPPTGRCTKFKKPVGKAGAAARRCAICNLLEDEH